MSEQNREARDLELRYQQSLRTIRAGQDPVPRVRRDPVIEIESSSTWSTADISTDSSREEQPTNAPEQRAVSSDSEECDSPRQALVPRAKALVREAPVPQPKPKPKARAKQRAGPRAKLPRALDRLALLRRVHQRRRLVQAAEREARRQARVQRVEERREREQRRRLGLPTRSPV